MATKAIKGVDEEKWAAFKALAAKSDMRVGEFFNESVEILERSKAKSQWERIMEHVRKHPSKLTDADIKRMREFRKNFRMRRFNEIRT
jgi:hypothetical protein